ncbi:hypothetical protein F4818DRAFT_427369 [Hypoxylon cercidicola]|nr:hypothetical protein F4818DRAFT_427369 [Hypoxylon cercidicola]
MRPVQPDDERELIDPVVFRAAQEDAKEGQWKDALDLVTYNGNRPNIEIKVKPQPSPSSYVRREPKGKQPERDADTRKRKASAREPEESDDENRGLREQLKNITARLALLERASAEGTASPATSKPMQSALGTWQDQDGKNLPCYSNAGTVEVMLPSRQDVLWHIRSVREELESVLGVGIRVLDADISHKHPRIEISPWSKEMSEVAAVICGRRAFDLLGRWSRLTYGPGNITPVMSYFRDFAESETKDLSRLASDLMDMAEQARELPTFSAAGPPSTTEEGSQANPNAAGPSSQQQHSGMTRKRRPRSHRRRKRAREHNFDDHVTRIIRRK